MPGTVEATPVIGTPMCLILFEDIGAIEVVSYY